MTLEKAVELILTNTITWINTNSESRPGFIYTNFSSFFIHECKLLNQTNEFSKWHTLSWLKSRNLRFDFDKDNDLTTLSFYINSGNELQSRMSSLNSLFTYYIGTYRNSGYIGTICLKSKLQEEAVKRKAYTPTSLFATDLTKKTELLDISKITNFKF